MVFEICEDTAKIGDMVSFAKVGKNEDKSNGGEFVDIEAEFPPRTMESTILKKFEFC